MSALRGRILGIDYGTRRIGLALSDPLGIIAGGCGTLENDAGVLGKIVALVEEQAVGLIVVGIPFAPDGGKGKKGMEVDQFVVRLRDRVQVPIAHWDESYSTREAARVFREGGMKRKQRQRRTGIDEMAARVMLQEYLDHHSTSSLP